MKVERKDNYGRFNVSRPLLRDSAKYPFTIRPPQVDEDAPEFDPEYWQKRQARHEEVLAKQGAAFVPKYPKKPKRRKK